MYFTYNPGSTFEFYSKPFVKCTEAACNILDKNDQSYH